MKLSGAHLVWRLNSPKWFDQITGPKRVESEMVAHIRREVSWFRGQVFSWNVHNELIEPRDGRADGLRNESAVVTTLGDAGLAAAFHAAREADPFALLVYNDSDLELDTPRQAALLNLADRLLAAKAPLDAVGLQSHLRFEQFHDFNPRLYRGFLAELAGRGLKILITELDVFDAGAPAEIARARPAGGRCLREVSERRSG
jgi:endo-1,4-beta-xylanase